jgi:hypothetical protein
MMLMRAPGLVIISAMVLGAIAGWTGVGSAAAPDAATGNLLLNSDLKADGGDLPTGWKVHVVPPCGFSYQLHQADNAAGEFEIINDQAVESTLGQTVSLKPGWYVLSAEIKVETLGSEGSSPELFAQAITLPVYIRTHPMGWKSGWHRYRLYFKTGPSVGEVEVGCALGSWGSPNSGRILMRNPVLVATERPHSAQDLTNPDGYDLQKIADSRFGSPEAKEAFYPLKYPPGRSWTVFALYFAFLVVAIFGWWRTAPRRST